MSINPNKKILYTAEAVVEGGREGHGRPPIPGSTWWEEDAAGIIALAACAVEASEYAVIDAALARAEADDLEAAR